MILRDNSQPKRFTQWDNVLVGIWPPNPLFALVATHISGHKIPAKYPSSKFSPESFGTWP